MVQESPLLKEQTFVYKGKQLNFLWEKAGISLHFPAVTCETDIKISVKVMTNVEENCTLPHGYRLMPMASAIYKISASNALPAPVRVKMQHCVTIEKEDSLIHVVAHDGPPYQFKLFKGGKFEKSYGEIEMTEFSLWGIICNTIGLNILLAIHVVYFCDNTANIVVTENIPPHCQAIKEQYELTPGMNHIEPYTMRSNSSQIAFFVDSQTTDEWSIEIDPTPAFINMTDICSFQPGSIPPHIKLEFRSKVVHWPHKKKVKLEVDGGDRTSLTLQFDPPEQRPSQPLSPAISAELRALRKSYGVFTSAVDPDYLVRKLYSECLLTPTEKEKATQRTLTTSEKLEECFKIVEQRVSSTPEAFHTMLQALKDEPAMEGVFDIIQGKKIP